MHLLGRRLTFNEVRSITQLSIVDIPGADVFARHPDGQLMSVQEQLADFRARNKMPAKGPMAEYLKTRRMHNSKSSQAQMHTRVMNSMDQEVMKGRFQVFDEVNDGKFQCLRLEKLARLGVLTPDNAPGLVPIPSPLQTDNRWGFAKKEHVKNWPMLDILYDWHDFFFKSLTYAKASGHLKRAKSKVDAGRAYHLRALSEDQWLHVYCDVDRSCVKKTQGVWLVFEQPVGRGNSTVPRLVSARCGRCTAGENHPACDHILAALSALEMLSRGKIIGGDVGDGVRGWGRKQDKKGSSHVECQPMKNVALLTNSGRLSYFKGRRPDAPPPVCHIKLFIRCLQHNAPKSLPLVIVELHNGLVVAVRRGAVLSHKKKSTLPPEGVRKALFCRLDS